MSDTRNTDPFAEALSKANADLGLGSPTEPLPAPTVETEAVDPTEQAESPEPVQAVVEDNPEPDPDELFGSIEVPETPQPEPTEQTFTLPGIDNPVTLEQLKEGYLREADYTRKTQALAAERKALAEADEFHKAFLSDPHNFAKQLAVAAGYISEDANPVKVVDLPIKSDADFEAEVTRRVEEALSQHPDLVAARQQAAWSAVQQEIARIEDKYEVKLGEQSVRKLLQRADQAGTADLELVFNAMMAEVKQRESQLAQAKAAAPRVPTGSQSVAAEAPAITSIEEAAEYAKRLLGITQD